VTAEIRTDVEIGDYHKSPRLTNSKLGEFVLNGPRYFYERHVARTNQPRPSTEAQIFGQAFESLLCEPGVFEERYAIKPTGLTADGKKWTYGTVEGKAWKAAREAEGKVCVEKEEVEAMFAMRKSFFENKTAVEMVKASIAQATILADFPGTAGIQARPDFMSMRGCPATQFTRFTLDLKTTIKFLKLTNGRGVFDLKYHVQAAIVRECWRQCGHRGEHHLLVIEKKAPYRVQVVEIPPSWLDMGWRWVERHAPRIVEHLRTEEWPRVYFEKTRLPEPDRWMENQSDEEENDEEAA
jgi:hypothetical protein